MEFDTLGMSAQGMSVKEDIW